jgi:murein DD-endopeptidase MepM/ murein hydrolase activator NlpD
MTIAEHLSLAPPWWYRAGARVRGFATAAGFLGLFAGLLTIMLASGLPDALLLALTLGGFALLAVGLVLTLFPAGPKIAPRTVAPPVAGRWIVMNGPADRAPSHGTHGHGQTFAVDLVYEPQEGARPAFGKGASFRRPEEFPGFGQELLAPADGEVVAVWDRGRDHLTRSTWPAVAYMVLESFVREIAGSKYVLGNHVILSLGDDTYAALTHLKRGSAAVRVGQRVRRGDVIGRCGNSGNSSEPHLHFQLMDHPRALVAAGLPFGFTGVNGVPANDQALVV